MGYDVHITRASRWRDSNATPVPLTEWLRYVEEDPEFSSATSAHATVGGATLTYTNPGLAVWLAHGGGVPVWFDHRRGRVTVKNPDEEVLEKMLRVAHRLDAWVLGDEGEEYSYE